MSTIRRTIVLNDIEPSPLSMRVPSAIDTLVDISYRDQQNNPWPTDIAAHLQLTGRSNSLSASYAVIATDIANGRATAKLPAGSVSDPFGHRLRLYGSIGGGLALIATGVAMPIDMDAPDTVSVDVIDDISIAMQRDLDVDLQVDLWQSADKSAEYDTGGSTVSAIVWADSSEVAQLAPFSVTSIDANTLALHLDAAVVDTLPDTCWWSLRIASGGGVTTLAHGTVSVVSLVTRAAS